jgi:LCP family protein required for cell wall assembly
MRKSDNKKKYMKYGIIALSIVFLISVALILIDVWEKNLGLFPGQAMEDEKLTYNGEDFVLRDNIETFLVMGLDKNEGTAVVDSYNNDQQADFLMLFVFDNEAKTTSVIHVNRDTMADVNVLGVAGNRVGVVKKQIALAHTYGNGRDVSCRNTADAVSKLLLGVKVNHYISLSMDSVAVINDLVGGVEVTVLDDFTGIDDTLIKGEEVKLVGDQALVYIRTRYGLEDSTNSTRMIRQRQYVNALYEKFVGCIEADESFVVEATLEMSDYIVSDRSVTQLQELARKFSEYEFIGIESIEGESVVGDEFMEFYADEDSILKIVVDKFYEADK